MAALTRRATDQQPYVSHGARISLARVSVNAECGQAVAFDVGAEDWSTLADCIQRIAARLIRRYGRPASMAFGVSISGVYHLCPSRGREAVKGRSAC